MSRYLLIPTDGGNTTMREITLPEGIMPDPYSDLSKRVSDQETLKHFLIKLTNADIASNDDGEVKYRDGIIAGVNFNDVVVDSCNGIFKDCHEPFYTLLRSYGITF